MFIPNQTVLAFHGPLIYQAKVVKTHHGSDDYVSIADGKTESTSSAKLPSDMLDMDAYFLHYQGWNAKWDEWVTDSRILEDNEENRARKTELENLRKRKRPLKKEKKAVVKKEKIEPRREPVKKKRIHVISMDLCNSLKYVLIDDWEFVTKSKKLVDLPAKQPVATILKDYAAHRLPGLSERQRAVSDDIIRGLEAYFNQSLNLLLLYKVENLQYMNFLKDKTVRDNNKSSVYGVEHLLRLLVSMPNLVGQTNMDAPSVNVLMAEVSELAGFLGREIKRYANGYVNTSPQYDSLSRI